MNVEVSFDNSNQYIRVKGELTSLTVMDALKQFSRECKKLPAWVIDFTQVTKVDSSALAMLIELKRNAVKNKKTISFIYLPATLIKIARLSQLEAMLNEPSATPKQ